jgi:hypothetical protein
VKYLDVAKCDPSKFHFISKTLNDHVNNCRAILGRLSSIAPGTMSLPVMVFVLLALFLKLCCRLCTELFSSFSSEICLTFGFGC